MSIIQAGTSQKRNLNPGRHLVSEINGDAYLLCLKKLSGKFGGNIGRVGFATEYIYVGGIGLIGKVPGNQRGLDQLGHRITRHAWIFAKINDDGRAKFFPIDKRA